jgi:hypothetical protein
MVKKGTKAWADTPDDWVDDLRGGVEKQEPVGYLYDWLNPDNREEVIRDWFAASMYVIEKDKGFNVRPLYTAPVHASKQAEQEPVAFRNINTGEFCTGGFLRKDWAKWQPLYAAPVHASDMSQERVDETAKDQHEPVEYDCCANCLHPEHEHNGNQCPKPLTTVWHAWDYDFPPDNYAAPLKREWLGLTDEEIMAELPVTTSRPATSFARAIEARLKEKNT